MQRNRQPRKSFFRRLLDSKALLIGETIIAVLILTALGREFAEQYSIRQEVRALEEERSSLQERTQELSSLVQYFESDFYRESEARTKFGLQKEGESEIVVPSVAAVETQQSGLSQNVASETSTANTTGQDTTNPRRWWNYFFN